MTPQEGNIILAEACGFIREEKIHRGSRSIHWYEFKGQPHERKIVAHELPDYYNDLNVCAEFEKILDENGCRKYNEILCKIVVPLASLFPPFTDRRCTMWLFHATAPQRWEAALRTLGRWKD